MRSRLLDGGIVEWVVIKQIVRCQSEKRRKNCSSIDVDDDGKAKI